MKDVSNMKSDTYDPDINLCARQVVSQKKKNENLISGFSYLQLSTNREDKKFSPMVT